MLGENVRTIRVGSRRSQLALVQTHLAIDMLRAKNNLLEFEVVKIATVGDKIIDVALSKIGDKSLFTKELERALEDNEVDFVVHSLKDVPTSMPEGLVLGCVFDRTSPEDVVLMSPKNRGRKLRDLPEGSIVGTSALRRSATLKRLYPHLNFISIRGNLNTRLNKLDRESETVTKEDDTTVPTVRYDAIVLAKAGIERLGWADRIDEVLDNCFHAVSQGALACECRKNDTFILSVLADLHNESACLSAIAERSLMRYLDGGCSTPIGVRHQLIPSVGHPRHLVLEANVLSVDGTQYVEASVSAELPHLIPRGSKRPLSVCENDVEEMHSLLPKKPRISGSDPREGHPPASELTHLNLNYSEEELQSADDPSAVFMGVHVNPICSVARLRMARSKRVGRILAEKLLASGASRILEEIRSQTLTANKTNVATSPVTKWRRIKQTWTGKREKPTIGKVLLHVSVKRWPVMRIPIDQLRISQRVWSLE
ncbi:hydroxymethylbilane synthase [Clonorchis sinensis]|uniref:hydroxymethylbilane synthase n=2 Tax=Clonorchis sinensis TaxID=79923 RepID=G7Y4X4_CLOSI|nr:hydroxymethylbilane synthase [Clonorchis sinensis]